MARTSVIDQKALGPRVLTMAAGGLSSRKIAEALAKDGVKLSHVAIKNYLAANAEEQKVATENVRAAVQAELQREALSDVQMLEELRDMAYKALKEAPPEDRISKEWAAVMGQLRGVVDLRLKVAGASNPDNPPVNVNIDVASVIRDEIQKATAGAPKSLDEINQQYPLPPPPNGVRTVN